MSGPARAADAAALWTACMRRGDFEGAWAVNDMLRQSGLVQRSPAAPRHLQSVWDGSPIDGRRVLVRCYHGLGDTLQFIRYVAAVRARARAVAVWAQPALLPLLSTVCGIDVLRPLHDGAVEEDYDVDVEIMEMPYVLRTTRTTIPANVPYLFAKREPLQGVRPAVGLVWRAGDWAEHRSIPFRLLAPLVSVPVTWYVLQGEPGLSDRPVGFGILAGTADIDEAARVIGSLDLLITIDSMPAHLAGALAAPVWTLLPADADWRWMTGRDDSPWYPTMRLFRQERPGEWEPVIARVASELSRLVGR